MWRYSFGKIINKIQLTCAEASSYMHTACSQTLTTGRSEQEERRKKNPWDYPFLIHKSLILV